MMQNGRITRALWNTAVGMLLMSPSPGVFRSWFNRKGDDDSAACAGRVPYGPTPANAAAAPAVLAAACEGAFKVEG